MAPGKYDLAIYQGDSFSITVFLKQEEDGNPAYDLTGWTAKAQMRSKDPAENATVAIEFTCTVDAEAGSIEVSASASETALVVAGRYSYDLQITDGNLVQTILRGTAIVSEEVTKP